MNDIKHLRLGWVIIILFFFATIIIPIEVFASAKQNIQSKKVAAILEKFNQFGSIPRCTKQEKNALKWLKKWAKQKNLKTKSDSKGNLVIQVPATRGFEKAPTLVLQGHVDMVCEKAESSKHNFKKDPIKLVWKGDWLHADGTTLGADNGIGVAVCMALVEDVSIAHPPLELLFTVEEEIGSKGAAKLGSGLIKGRLLINIDSEVEGTLTIGSAGGTATFITLPTSLKKLPKELDIYNLEVSGLQGGHSALDINKNRGNAIIIMARLLEKLNRAAQIRILSVQGGTKPNAIPRSAEASLAIASGQVEDLKNIVKEFEQNLRSEFAAKDKYLSIALQPKNEGKKPKKAISQKDTNRIINLLNSLPNGVAEMSAEFKGNVETSNNIGQAFFKGTTFTVLSLQRSAVTKKLNELQSKVKSAAKNAGAKAKEVYRSPAWVPNTESPLFKRGREIYYSTFGNEPKVHVTHGGLECRLFVVKYPKMDMISIGPTIENAHSPGERLYIPSVEKLWRFLTALLASYGG